MKQEFILRRAICEVGKLLYDRKLVVATDGNISIRLDQDRVLCTPTQVCKGMMQADDMIVCDMQGKKISGTRERTSEIMMHLTVYNLRPDIRSVVHAHPPVATGYAAAGRSLNLALLPEVVIGLGCVPLAGYGLPGTPELTDPMLPLIPKYEALLMGNHGAVCYGEDLYKAFFRMETVEHFARISLVTELLGGAQVLPKLEVDKLLEARARYGITTRAGLEAGCPLAAEELGRERFYVTREELVALVDEAMRARK